MRWLTVIISDISHVGGGKDDSLKLSWSEFKISKNKSLFRIDSKHHGTLLIANRTKELF